MNRVTISRILLVIATALVVLVYYAPLGNMDYLNDWRSGTFGLAMPAFSTTIQRVDNPKLLRDGIRPGDTVEGAVLWRQFSQVAFPRAGQTLTIRFHTRQGIKTETLTAVRTPGFDVWQVLGGILAILPATVFLVVAFMLVFAKPSVMTWSFFLYAVGYFSTKSSVGYYSFLPEGPYLVLMFFFNTFFGNFAALPLVPFVLRFPNNDMSGWRKKIDPWVWLYLGVAFALYVVDFVNVVRGGGRIPQLEHLLDNILPLSAFAFSALIVIKNFKTAAPDVRQRLIWLIGGTLISFLAYAVYFVPNIPSIGFVSPRSDAIKQVVGYAAVLMPITVAYAVFRHRVIDVNFVVNRAIVYGALSIILLAFVSLLDWFLGKVLGGAHLTTFLEASVTIAVGFALNRLHQTFEDWVDRFLFWRRHRAERFLKRVAAALPFATSEEAITDGLVHEPVESLDLAGAALYRRSDDAPIFEFVDSHRASPMFARFEFNHNLVRFLQSEEAVVWLDELGTHVESQISVFVIAVPVIVRHQLLAFTLYAAHRNGAQIDPDEVGLFEELALEAARAYDHVEAVRTREQLEVVRQRLERLGSNPQLG